jgi:hypothetical protein
LIVVSACVAQGPLLRLPIALPSQRSGVAFKVDTTGTKTVLHSFTRASNGSQPLGGLIRDRLPDDNSKLALGPKSGDRAWIGRVPIYVDHSQPDGLAAFHGRLQEAFDICRIALGREPEIDDLRGGVHIGGSSVQKLQPRHAVFFRKNNDLTSTTAEQPRSPVRTRSSAPSAHSHVPAPATAPLRTSRRVPETSPPSAYRSSDSFPASLQTTP